MALSVLGRHTPNKYIPTGTPDGKLCKYTGHSVRAVPIRIVTVGKKRSRGVQLIFDEYKEKLQHYCTIDDVLIRSNPRNARDAKAQIEDEDIAVISLCKTDDWVVILDEDGQDVSSERFAEFIGAAGVTGVVFLTYMFFSVFKAMFLNTGYSSAHNQRRS